MRKNIDIPDNYIEALQMLCVKEKTNPKNWIEKTIVRRIDLYWQEQGMYVKPNGFEKTKKSVGKNISYNGRVLPKVGRKSATASFRHKSLIVALMLNLGWSAPLLAIHC